MITAHGYSELVTVGDWNPETQSYREWRSGAILVDHRGFRLPVEPCARIVNDPEDEIGSPPWRVTVGASGLIQSSRFWNARAAFKHGSSALRFLCSKRELVVQ